MEDADAKDSCSETINEQIERVTKETKGSKVCQFGDMSIKEEVVGNFEGSCDTKRSPVDIFFKNLWNNKPKEKIDGNPVNSRDVKLHYLMNKFIKSGLKEDQILLQAELDERTKIEDRFEKFASKNHLDQQLTAPFLSNHACYKEVVEEYSNACTQGEYDLKYFHFFV